MDAGRKGRTMFLYEGIEKADKKVRAVLIGCGEQATNMIHNAISYIDEIEVVGVCDMNKDRADFAARRFGLSRSWQDMDEMLKNVEADCAFVITIAKLQAPLALKCVEAGLHVFTEKPLGTEKEDIEKLIEAAKKNNKKIGVSFNKRFNLAYHDMKGAIDSEGFGAPSAFSAKFIGGYRTNETDLLRVGSCHFFDLARYLIGEVDEVFAYRYEKQPGQHTFAVTMQFENGCVGTMMLGSLGSWVCGYGISEDGLVDFFVSVAKSVPEDFPVYLYAIPQYAMNDISVAAAEKAAAQYPNIVGIKYSYPDMTRIQQMMRISDGTFSVLAGPDQLLTAVVSMGGDGVVSGSSQVIPEYYEAVWEALEKNDYKLAAERQQLTNRLNEALCSVNNIAAYKAVLAYQGIIKTKKTRKPLEEYTEQQTRELFRVLKEIVKEK